MDPVVRRGLRSSNITGQDWRGGGRPRKSPLKPLCWFACRIRNHARASASVKSTKDQFRNQAEEEERRTAAVHLNVRRVPAASCTNKDDGFFRKGKNTPRSLGLVGMPAINQVITCTHQGEVPDDDGRRFPFNPRTSAHRTSLLRVNDPAGIRSPLGGITPVLQLMLVRLLADVYGVQTPLRSFCPWTDWDGLYHTTFLPMPSTHKVRGMHLQLHQQSFTSTSHHRVNGQAFRECVHKIMGIPKSQCANANDTSLSMWQNVPALINPSRYIEASKSPTTYMPQ
ncbi:hypothetical protein SODALDRAFT_360523 [Sodiomyces alkalinus F11]|uniref:Uncharacterized protein n=1 Tax=Sodiomyces alkalinus (strain CBS 110278 / VKM F-3762 / F11) TaxID=1314773 RepID=A0A3N2PUP3_SODAK|nr:hypothetical protein SODALDRAFT_360523 [Sodiomyces alkalinus F11]ROT38184.1 hypothetical protein SODALDRAFT_360523 [Sodiomyces alkalinus F11]